MKIITFMLNDLKITLRNPVTFGLLLLMPILMISLMGYSLKSVFQVDEKGVERFQILYANKDDGYIGKSFDSFIKGEGSKFVDVIHAGEDAKEQVLANRYPAAIIIPANLSRDITEGRKANIEVIGSGKDFIKEKVVQSLTVSFIDAINSQSGIMRGYEHYMPGESRTDQVLKAAAEAANAYGNEFVEFKQIEKDKSERLSSFQYFAASMLVFFLLTTGMGLGVSILNERENRTFMRIQSYPVSENQYLLGKALANALIAILQAAVVVLFTRFAFHVGWGSNYFIIGLAVITVMLISSGMAVIFSSLLNSSKALSSSLTIFFWMMTFISGGFTKVPAFEPIARYTVNRWAFDSITGAMLGESFSQVSFNVVLLALLGLIIWITGVLLYKRRSINE